MEASVKAFMGASVEVVSVKSFMEASVEASMKAMEASPRKLSRASTRNAASAGGPKLRFLSWNLAYRTSGKIGLATGILFWRRHRRRVRYMV